MSSREGNFVVGLFVRASISRGATTDVLSHYCNVFLPVIIEMYGAVEAGNSASDNDCITGMNGNFQSTYVNRTCSHSAHLQATYAKTVSRKGKRDSRVISSSCAGYDSHLTHKSLSCSDVWFASHCRQLRVLQKFPKMRFNRSSYVP